MSEQTPARLLSDETAELLAWHESVEDRHDDPFEAAKELVTRLGAHVVGDRDHHASPAEAGRAEFGFWTPELVDDGVSESDVYLELLTPTESGHVAFDTETETHEFHRERVPLERNGAYHWGVVEGVRPGTKAQLGSLYQLVYEEENEWHEIQDPLSVSVPFGVFAPAEVYDLDRLDAVRADREYFEELGTDDEPISTTEHDGLPRVDPAVSMLELHPGTSSEAGSLAGLARTYEEIGRKWETGEQLTPAERNFTGYDAVQVMPVEPLTENEDREPYFRPEDAERAESDESERSESVSVSAERPDMINWGYDIVVAGFSAVNPAILETGRPDELVEFIATLHNLPRPIRVVFDIALGHADNGGLELLNDYYFEGPGMYGQHLDYTEPTVRAILLEMQRRKMDFGADGIRVDGAQDFTYYDEEKDEMIHDDAFLTEMDAVVQEVGGTTYRPWMIYEDGRPWPREDWELASTYRALIEQHPHSFQWSPITFAHNTPALLTFWATKWWRVREVAEFGGQWLTGVANHDTIRRGTQIDASAEFNQSPVNPYLGETLPETLDEAYDNAASTALFHAFMPGVPMDFAHANMRAPWGFVRDTDAPWNVKVVSEESNFVDWQIRPEQFEDDAQFQRLKELGFTDLGDLRTFIRALSSAVEATDYDLDTMATMLQALDTPFSELSADDLEAFGYAWMRDVHDFANLAAHADEQDPERTAFDLEVREFRQRRPWLRADLAEGDFFDYRHPTNGTVLYYGFRESPDGDEQLLFAANMEGVPIEVFPGSLDVPDLPTGDWEVELQSLDAEETPGGIRLSNGDAVVWSRTP
ncbi:hypothetical protein AUR64_04625 [Haloprofundus marisrubri]|uniref:Alpha-amylase n=1 Tax=Haloprofundus marisrubri TaxID=1514971 RepID=A0A0W1RCD9_9EURY|nr:glucosylglycerol hydrolase [Haloprofundus marisrubri]KTG11217.1 hypothetical protein AUR64_04625 [Haloprofundus marisrubri]